MKDQVVADATNLARLPKEAPVSVVIAYDDLAAGKRAMHAMGGLGKGLNEEVAFNPVPWRFDLVADMDWRAMATADALAADILIIAASAVDAIPAAISRWMEEIIQQKRGTMAAVVALFGTDEIPDQADSSRLEALRQTALQAGLAFFSPSPIQQPQVECA